MAKCTNPKSGRQTPRTDWAALMPAVARTLLGDPPRKSGGQWRYGAKGSLVVSVSGDRAGSWHSFEDGEGGGVLALVEHRVGLSPERRHAAAIAWLRERGLIPAKSQPAADPDPPSVGAEETTKRPPRKSGPPVEPHVIWSAGERPHPDTPAWRYLAGRLVWPPTNTIFPDIPPSVRWMPLSGEATPPYFRRALPSSAAGLVLYAFHRWIDGERGPLVAVSMEAVRAEGTRCRERWRRAYGPRTGALFDAGTSSESPTDRLVLVEGEVSALAARWLYPGHRAMATGGSSGLARISTNGLPRGISAITVDGDGDSAGDRSGFIALYSVIRACPGIRVKGIARSGGADAADELAEWVGERVAIVSEGLPDEGRARVEAWRSVCQAKEVSHEHRN